MAKLLFLEDEETIRSVLTEYLKMAGFEVDPFENGDDACKALLSGAYDLCILDINVPGMSGLEVLRTIKEKKIPTATLMLSAIDDELTQSTSFDLLADDYVVKPVSPLLLVKRVQTILRRVRRAEPEEEGLWLDADGYEAYFRKENLHLTVSEFLLLKALMDEPERVFTREQLILKLYNEDYIGNDRIIDAHIKNLRKKLPVQVIKTVIGVGYKYSAGESS